MVFKLVSTVSDTKFGDEIQVEWLLFSWFATSFSIVMVGPPLWFDVRVSRDYLKR